MDFIEGEKIDIKRDDPKQVHLSDEEINKKYRDKERQVGAGMKGLPLLYSIL